MRNIVYAAVALFFTTSLSTAQVQAVDFTSLLGALKQGKDVRAVLDYSKCRLVVRGKETPAPQAIGGMKLETFEYFAAGAIGNPKAFITASQSVLITHPTRGHVYNYVKLRVFEDDTVEIAARYLNPVTFEIVMDETFYGQISTTGQNRGAAFFIQNPSAK